MRDGSDTLVEASTDSVMPVADSLRQWGLVFTQEHTSAEDYVRPTVGGGISDSWVTVALLLLFVIIAVRYRSNTRFMHVLLQDMSSIRERGNVFNDTVRETSFMVLLNLLWVCSGGVMLSAAVGGAGTLCAAACAGVIAVYTLVMMAGYSISGRIFTDARHAAMWTRGFTSGQGVGSLLMFPLALLQLCYSNYSEIWVICALIVLIIVKIVFIWQGFRIFFSQCGSLLLFLYYLCSLEIVPLILSYMAAAYVCSYLL